MKMFIPLLCLLSFTIAEPPVGDSYTSARSSYSHDHLDFQGSPSQQYGPPSQIPSSRNSLSTDYSSPTSRTSTRLSPTYGSPRISEKYGVPNARSSSKLSQEYGTPITRNTPSYEYGTISSRNSPSQAYGVPTTRHAPSQKYGAPSSRNNPSQEYGAPSSRSSPSQEYGVPTSRNSPSQEYGAPQARNAPSEEYGVPSTRNDLSQEYGVPASRSSLSQEYGVPNGKNRQSSSHPLRNSESANPSTSYGAPGKISKEYGIPHRNTFSKAQKPHKQYLPQKNTAFGKNGVPGYSPKSTFNSERLSQSYTAPKPSNSLSTTYGVPSPSSDYSQEFSDFGARDLSDTYGVPSSRLSQEYGAPKTADLKTDAVASSYSSARSSSSPSSTYGAPSVRDSLPSDQYGVPEQYSARSNQGYEYGRASEEDYQEPANYQFAYNVNDYITGSDFGHKESRQENRAEGTYFVVLPDGNKQVVEYEADERGFKPRISVEPVDAARSGGYDDNAADLDDSEGPY